MSTLTCDLLWCVFFKIASVKAAEEVGHSLKVDTENALERNFTRILTTVSPNNFQRTRGYSEAL